MKNNKLNINHIVILIGFVLLVSGCSTYRSYVPVDLKDVHLEVPVRITYISIEDNRVEISKEDDIKIPFMSGLKKKAWKHHPRLTKEHKLLIENTIRQNFLSNAMDTATFIVSINYACKEFEQTGMSEIERVYLNIETWLKTQDYEYSSSAIDTFHFQSIDASNKHFEKFFQTSLQNNIVRNISVLRHHYYNSEVRELECFDRTYSNILKLNNNATIEISGSKELVSFAVTGELKSDLTQEWNFKIVTNPEGKLTYIESLVEIHSKNEELMNVLNYLHNLRIVEADTHEKNEYLCRNLLIRNTSTGMDR